MTDRQLTELLTEAVADIEPADRLAEIKERTVSATRRTRWYAAGGACLAVAAAVAAIAVVGDPRPSTEGIDPGAPGPSADAEVPSALYPVYYFGDTSAGPRLFREFQRRRGSGGSLVIAALLVSSPPDDPNYRTLWPEGAFLGAQTVTLDGQTVVRVDIGDVSLDRPRGVTSAEAELAVQQVVYTMQATAGDDTLPVRFFLGDAPVDTMLGVDVSEPVDTAPQLDVLSLMNISTPAEHAVVSGLLVADGRASSFEGNVLWELRDADTREVVLEGFTTTAGVDDHLTEWETEPIDVSDLVPGIYTFVASTSDPSDGEGLGVFTDTRTIVVE